jgi:DNA-binding CsgD family transcriptional regulator
MLALPGFLNALTQCTHADSIIQTLIDGPLRPYRASALWFAHRKENGLELQASCGFPPAMIGRYRLIKMDLEAPGPVAIHNAEVVKVPLQEVLSTFPSLQIDAALWQELQQRFASDSWLVSVPIQFQGSTIGIYAFVSEEAVDWDMSDSHFLLGLGAALGLWLAANGSWHGRRNPDLTDQWYTQETPLHLTPRQKDILLLIERNKSNAAIATSLGYSVSTIKIEIRRALRMLRAVDRHTAVATARELNLL